MRTTPTQRTTIPAAPLHKPSSISSLSLTLAPNLFAAKYLLIQAARMNLRNTRRAGLVAETNTAAAVRAEAAPTSTNGARAGALSCTGTAGRGKGFVGWL